MVDPTFAAGQVARELKISLAFLGLFTSTEAISTAVVGPRVAHLALEAIEQQRG